MVLGTFLFLKWKRIQLPSISNYFIASIFIVKCLLSILYIYTHYKYYSGGDIALFHKDGLIIYNTLFTNPNEYMELVFGINDYKPVPDLIYNEIEAMGLWWDNGLYSVVRFCALTNLFTFGNIYCTGIFMAFVTTIGLMLLYQSIYLLFPSKASLIKLIAFGIPSVLFFSSGIHKEGLMLTSLAVFFYAVVCLYLKFENTLKYLVLLLVAAFLLLQVRNFAFYLLIPGALAFCISLFNKKYLPAIYFFSIVTIASLSMLLYFSDFHQSVFISGNFLKLIAIKQQLFESLATGNSKIEIEKFEPNLFYFLRQLPIAFLRGFCAPLFLNYSKPFQLIFIIENFILLLFLMLLIYCTNYKTFKWNALLMWQLLFAISMLVLMGIVVSNIGATIRYRSVVLPFFFMFFVANFDYKKLNTILSKYFYLK